MDQHGNPRFSRRRQVVWPICVYYEASVVGVSVSVVVASDDPVPYGTSVFGVRPRNLQVVNYCSWSRVLFLAHPRIDGGDKFVVLANQYRISVCRPEKGTEEEDVACVLG